ncbi:MAG TPA: TIGR03668 family PPOX class F420-dependent oxidoreductase [Candidatus Limnocylindrales bacterium]|nr:TIGR03668 family PPOX class F420-dependent oxidoreductase [Candidatus Limnocylindrales bacterium]
MSLLASLAPAESALLAEARRAVLATLRPDGRPRLVPITFAADEHRDVLYSPLDEKRKTVSDPRRLARVRDILARPSVTLLVDRWSEDWTTLIWLRLDGRATLLEPGEEHGGAVGQLRRRYPQYANHRIESQPLLRFTVEAVRGWAAR